MISVGIDGGGSTTRAVLLAEDGTVLGSGKAGPSSIDTVAMETTVENIRLAVRQALVEANFPGTSLAGAVRVLAGLGGIVTAEDSRRVELALAGLAWPPATRVTVLNDMKIAWAGSFGLKPGIICILGTGSVAYGRNAAGEEGRAGGWGYKEGDPGSSYDLGLGAIRSLVRAADGRLPETEFTRQVQQALELAEVSDLPHLLYQQDLGRTRIAALAPLVTTWAERGDPAAQNLVEQAAEEVSLMIATVGRRLFPSAPEAPAIPVSLVGGLATGSEFYRSRIEGKLGQRSASLVLTPPELNPVMGAALWAKTHTADSPSL